MSCGWHGDIIKNISTPRWQYVYGMGLPCYLCIPEAVP